MKRSALTAAAFLMIIATVFTFSFSAFGKDGYETPIIIVTSSTNPGGDEPPTGNPPGTTAPADPEETTTKPSGGEETSDPEEVSQKTSAIVAFFMMLKTFFAGIIGFITGLFR